MRGLSHYVGFDRNVGDDEVVAVPEPATFALAGLALLALSTTRRRKI
jgi:hypothetical protein